MIQHVIEVASVSSLDVLKIVFRLEDAYGVEIGAAAFDQVKTIDGADNYLWKSVSQTPPLLVFAAIGRDKT